MVDEPCLSKRPRGVRKHWKAEQLRDMAALGTVMREHHPALLPGDPVEGRRYSCRGQLKRLDARYANGRRVTISIGVRIRRIRLIYDA